MRPTVPCWLRQRRCRLDLVADELVLAEALTRVADWCCSQQAGAPTVPCLSGRRRPAPAAGRLAGLEADDRRRQRDRQRRPSSATTRPGAAARDPGRLDAVNEPRSPSREGIIGAKPQECSRWRTWRRRPGRRGRLAHRGATALNPPPSRGDTRRSRTTASAAREDHRVPDRKEAGVSTLVFLEHHGSDIPEGLAGRARPRPPSLDPDTSRGHHRLRRPRTWPPTRRATAPHACSSPTTPASTPPAAGPRVDVIGRLVRDIGFANVLFGASVLAADIAGGFAARLDAGLNWDLARPRPRGRHAGRQALGARRHRPRRRWPGRRATPRPGPVRLASSRPRPPAPACVERRRRHAAGLLHEGRDGRAGPRRADRSVDRRGRHPGRRRPRGRPRAFKDWRTWPAPSAEPSRRPARWWTPAGNPYQDPGRPDRQDRGAKLCPRVRCLRCHPAQGRQYEGAAGDRSPSTRTRTPPICDFSDLAVVGDLREIVPKLAP